jgi:ATP-dependent Clp protease ATP-binding subunit ClpC
MTSNIGVKKLQDFGAGVGFGTSKNVYQNEVAKKTLLMKELKNYFAPEFVNRLDEIIVFNTLQDSDVRKIVDVEMGKLISRLSNLKYEISFDESCMEHISKVGFDEVYGARPLKRAIQEKFEDFISDEVLRENIVIGQKYTIHIEDETVKLRQEELTQKEEKPKKPRKKKGE